MKEALIPMNVKKELQNLLAKQQEEEYFHTSMEEEFAFYRGDCFRQSGYFKGRYRRPELGAYGDTICKFSAEYEISSCDPDRHDHPLLY